MRTRASASRTCSSLLSLSVSVLGAIGRRADRKLGAPSSTSRPGVSTRAPCGGLELGNPRVDRLPPVAAVPAEGHRGYSASPRLLIDPGRRDPKKIGHLVRSHQRVVHAAVTIYLLRARGDGRGLVQLEVALVGVIRTPWSKHHSLQGTCMSGRFCTPRGARSEPGGRSRASINPNSGSRPCRGYGPELGHSPRGSAARRPGAVCRARAL
jgi:hypothetical protein